MKNKIIIILLYLLSPILSSAHELSDKEKIETLLAEGNLLRPTENLMLFYGRKFLGVPYVAHTLDKDNNEHLVINTRELDCTTFVENIVALTLCTKRGETKFEDFCKQLQKIRYTDGIVSYIHRNHYFTGWIEANVKAGFVKKVETKNSPFSATQKINLNWMTTHWQSYSMLKANPKWLDGIRKMEGELTGRTYKYIPKSALKNTKQLRNTIHDGDIIAILTNKKGLDTTHIGIAVWKSDGLHLLNASSVYKKVVEDNTLFYTYLRKRNYNTGIRVCRVA